MAFQSKTYSLTLRVNFSNKFYQVSTVMRCLNQEIQSTFFSNWNKKQKIMRENVNLYATPVIY